MIMVDFDCLFFYKIHCIRIQANLWYDYKEPLIDDETVVELGNLAQKNNVPEELIRNLLLSVYRNKNYSNQKILRDGIDRLLNQQWLHYEIIEEIENENQ